MPLNCSYMRYQLISILLITSAIIHYNCPNLLSNHAHLNETVDFGFNTVTQVLSYTQGQLPL